MHWSYNLGTKAVTMLTSNAKEFTRAASILGIFVVGGLIAAYGTTSLRIYVGDPAINIQGLLDGILPKLLPLLITLGIYTLIKKGWTPVKCILLILVTGIVGCAFGIFAGDSKAMDADGNTIPGGYNAAVKWYEYPAPAPAEKTGQQAYDAIQSVVDQLNKAGVNVTMPE
ncbi:PTS system mannose/fructose/sorbose family transporter subunit IID, partial [Clostridiaceae bacterium OM02-2AC]